MKKFPKKYLYYNLFLSIFGSIFFSIFLIAQLFLTEDPIQIDESWMVIIFLGAYFVIQILAIILIILRYHYTSYEIKEDLIKLKKGIIFKKEINLKYERMHAIDTKQNIIQKLFKITALSIDSGSTTKADKAEIVIVEEDDKIIDIQAKIKVRMQGVYQESASEEVLGEEVDNVLYRYSNKDKLMFVLMSSLVSVTIGILYFVFGSIFLNIFISDLELLQSILFGSVALFFAALLLTPITTYLFVLIRYYDYKVIIKSDHFIITHGLITKINHIINFKKIKGVKVEEGFIKRIFKYAAIKLEVVGFGQKASEDNKTQTFNYLIPLCKKADVEKIIESLNLNFRYMQKEHKAPKRAFRYFISLPIIIFSTIYFSVLPLILKIPFDTSLIMIAYFCLYLIVNLLIIVDGILKYQNSGITYDEVQTVIYYGSFTRNTLIILNKNITEVELIDTYCRGKRNIASINIHYFNNAYKNEAKALLLEKELFDNIKTLPKY